MRARRLERRRVPVVEDEPGLLAQAEDPEQEAKLRGRLRQGAPGSE